MKKKYNTVTYDLKDGKKIVYRGITKNPVKREKEHKASGKRFTQMVITSKRKMTEEGAKRIEKEKLNTYRKSHGGKNPKYNKDTDG